MRSGVTKEFEIFKKLLISHCLYKKHTYIKASLYMVFLPFLLYFISEDKERRRRTRCSFANWFPKAS